MNILCVGDVFGEQGCQILQKCLPKIKKAKAIDMVIVNGENSAVGNGITPASARMLVNCGADVVTGGNHTMRRKEIAETLEECDYILRPANLSADLPGGGYAVVDLGHTRVAVIRLLGSVYMECDENPFDAVDSLIQRAKDDGIKIVVVDFHAEVTSEKRAMGYYLDGKASAVFGTHTHIATADEQILPGGTGYITDIGMTGVDDSVLGVKKEIIVSRFKSGTQEKFLAADGEGSLNGCIFSVDKNTGKCLSVERIKVK